jgi:2-dehydropantoate 2-reductase
VPEILHYFNLAGLNARMVSNPEAMKWSKMLSNLLANATSAILDMTPKDIFSHQGLCKLEVFQIREALSVMKASNIPVIDLPGTPVRLLAWVINHLPLNFVMPLLRWKVGGGRGGKMPSFHIDLMNKRGRSEVEYLNGAVVRYGEILGIDTPINRLLTETLLALTDGTLNHTEFIHKPIKLLSLSTS